MPHPYFQEQLSFLRQGGRALAESFPRGADMLAVEGFDPDVERLLEGIAFITGTISERHDHGLTEICQLLFDIYFPHYLCPVPAAGIVQIEGDPCRLPVGTEILSVPVLGTPCRFRTTCEVDLSALELQDLSWLPGDSTGQLILHLQASSGIEGLDSLRLFLHGESLITHTLFQLLLKQLSSIDLLDPSGRTLATDHRPVVQPLGYADDQALLPYPPGPFSGFRLLQEYFTLPNKFLFVNLEGIGDLLRAAGAPSRFGLRLNLVQDVPRTLMLSQHNIRLNCTPVVNLFNHTADPIRRVPGRSEYLVRPAGPHLHYQVYRVLEVTGISSAGMMRYPLISEIDPLDAGGGMAQVHRSLKDDEWVTHITLDDHLQASVEQTIMLDLLCCNGQLPRGLTLGDVNQLQPPFDHLQCKNITALTPPTSVAGGEQLRRSLVKHLSLVQQDPVSLQSLRDALDLYHIQAKDDPQLARAHDLLLDSFVEVKSRPTQFHHLGVPVWGRSTHATLKEASFDCDGDLYIFGCILNELIARLTPLNVVSEFSVRRVRNQDLITWPKRLGKHELSTSS